MSNQGPRLFPDDMKQDAYREQSGKCKICNETFDFKEMEGDHIEPYSEGGKTIKENLQMLCVPCHQEKSND